jgi:hypothetical protein
MKVCAFCDASLSGKTRAKEHVYRDSWLVKLAHSETVTPLDLQSGTQLIEQRKPVADQVQAGAVCRSCNNGWMNDLDVAVEDVVLTLARSEKAIDRPGLERDMSLWLFKTAFAFSLVDKPERRHVPKEMMHDLRKGKLPRYFITFIKHVHGHDHHIGASLSDFWPSTGEPFIGLPQHTRFKFGIQYNNVIFGCAYATWDDAVFVTQSAYHNLIEFRGKHRKEAFGVFSSNLGPVAPTILNYVLATLGIESANDKPA